MRFSLRARVMGLPLALMAGSILTGTLISVWVVNDLWTGQLSSLSKSQEGLAQKSLRSIELQALTIAAMAAEVPGVRESFRLAKEGKEKEGRDLLRKSFDPIHKRVTQVLGISQFKVHFHLPPAKSFLRIWRKPGKKDGGDDISGFRQTVLTVNRDKKPVRGIEIGRGGFVIRGLVPISDKDGTHLGSVEALLDLSKMFETSRFIDSDNVAVYMLSSELEIAQRMKAKKLPQVGEMVRAFSSNRKATDPYLKKDLLKQAMSGMVSTVVQGQIVTALPISDFSGVKKGVLVFVRDASDLVFKIDILGWGLGAGGVILLLVIGLCLYIPISSIVRTLNKAVKELTGSSTQVTFASGELSSASSTLADGAANQASSLEETSASLEEIASMTRQNAENAVQANSLAKQASSDAESGKEDIQDMISAMGAINSSAEKISGIIKVIDEIAFQTNLLALNAAVEAARAGEQGKGFAVVAEEVRNLAQRSAEAAKDTANLIEESVSTSQQGSKLAGKSNEALDKIVDGSRKVADLLSKIASASQDQDEGVQQLNEAVTQIDQITQRNAAAAEESSAASEKLSSQSIALQETINDLMALITGQSKGNRAPGNRPTRNIRREVPLSVLQGSRNGNISSSKLDIDSFASSSRKEVSLGHGEEW